MEETNNNDTNDHKSELDAIKHEFHNFAKQKAKDYGHNSMHLECFPPEYNEEWMKFSRKLQKKIEALLTKVAPDHDLHLNLVLIKVFCEIRILLSLKVTNREKFIRTAESILMKCEKELRPLRKKASGVWLYVLNEVLYVQLIDMRNAKEMWLSPECQADFRKGLKLIEDADKHYTDFVQFQMEKPWGIDEIFCCYDKKGNQLKSELADDFYKFREYTMKDLLMQFSIKTEDEPKIRKYGIDGLRTFMMGHQNHHTIHMLVRVASNIVQPFTNVHYFKQAQHIIAVVMHRVVEFRRSLPVQDRTTVNPIQYDASYMFAELGNRLVRKSQELLMEEFFRRSGLSITQGHRNFHHDDCERLMPKSPELSQYEKQYPTQLTLDPEVYKKMQKKIRQWLNRMKELKRDSTAPHGLCLEPFMLIEERISVLESASTFPAPTLT